MSESKLAGLKALVFDVFGTVVDWRGSIIREMTAFARERRIDLDAEAFADGWRAGYQPAMQRVRCGELPWTKIDDLHRMILDGLIETHGIKGLTEAEKDQLNRVWHRLDPWPDAVEGLARLKGRYVIGTLSNGNVGLLVNMAKHAALPWDVVLSAEICHHYKPDPQAYQMVPALLGTTAAEVMLVAAHPSDLAAAAAQGLATGYVPRPLEFGPGRPPAGGMHHFDLVAPDFRALADALGA
jgi:2-haloacid dehalogenase